MRQLNCTALLIHTPVCIVSDSGKCLTPGDALQKGQAVEISWTVMFLGKTEAIQRFTNQLPDWVAATAMTTFQSSWKWSGSL